MNIRNKKIKSIINISGDKSISHRALMVSAISNGISTIHNFLFSQDSLATMECLRNLGIRIEVEDYKVRVFGNGLYSLRKYEGILDAKNSGTTIRIMSGILSGSNFDSIIDGDKSLRLRPMDRIIKPLSLMGGKIYALNSDNYAPLSVCGKELNSISYKMEIDSAQVKSCILFAGLYCDGITKVSENIKTRDHTERMIGYFGGNIKINGNTILIQKGEMEGREISIPGDISSASFFMVLASCIDGSELLIKNVGINETRIGIINVLRSMGANIELVNVHCDYFEEVCDIKVYGTKFLVGTLIEGGIIPTLIDEIPIICVLAVFAKGETIIRDIEELKYKESNRIKSIVEGFSKLGIEIYELENGIRIVGGGSIKGCEVDSYNDHRIAMSFMILSVISGEDIRILNKYCVDVSFPNFYDILNYVLR
ncbi:3-phosphoshikimate 1-carboxyvinyltransferase [Candidatus Arthromitus sp. SFB-mouse-Japan]|uniref:3-phosphoshikimate 1-carboxyvinyltransferase n=1 Tax=Candidatus Arthromitus sp. SFB-mouse TaxID=49118 RepID=UPI00021B81DC|nr:3-phosphoshikimate 1-carboxyvinyltransferase [Candidatus Arthromitus sp. SFB-mouse]EIA27641.1 3-phosphoshikimate 1-carboxyvinyltransferase [Candidatus Arthromitus sp. SFB-4]EIA28060.1 3-phosphoshikimate 1-carboxyvinyltransferase [Candidatus Arthromitus sp. SFB-co]EIA29981.1 3-phosphoshikimate 1-carboxyvinyltransferase [Candidatus Arthromitus sp. SFB-mouse-SU]EGX28356.1 3-phosphoshikimate 1-carboxyvinyltransferase [Candidatus Arthromitus sp. SFB-mouse-NYU]BAK56964.1 3-phosphoshikimate 1-carb